MAAQTQAPPPSAPKYYAASALLASQAAQAAAAARPRGLAALVQAIFRYQIIAATFAERAVGVMLAEQRIEAPSQASLNLPAFTTSPLAVERMTAAAETEAEFQRLVESITQETARAAQQAAVAVRPEVGWVRHLTLPSCSRCAVLAGRVYRWSDGFLRHPGCDCVMIPTAEDDGSMAYDLEELARSGQVTGLSKADLRALADGADFSSVVNVRGRKAGLTESGRILERAGRLTPAGIYAQAGDDRDRAIELLHEQGYARDVASGTRSGGQPPNNPPSPDAPAGPDEPDEYPPLPDGRRLPFKPSRRPVGTNADWERILGKHRHGANIPNKTMFPEDWADNDIKAATDATLAAPDTIRWRGDKVTFDRSVQGTAVRVQVRVDSSPPILWTAYPPEGTLST
ncbi:MAG: hypothetical protein ACRDTJ_08465 [Pseudonocardiaceae bacterium]